MANNNHSDNNQGQLRRCAFCGRNEHQVNFLIPSPTGIYICDFCVDACDELINQTLEDEEMDLGGGSVGSSLTLQTLPKPTEIKAGLDEYVLPTPVGPRRSTLLFCSSTSSKGDDAPLSFFCCLDKMRL